MVTASAMNNRSGFGSPAAISARSLAITLVVPSRIHATSTSGCFAPNASTVCWASAFGWLVYSTSLPEAASDGPAMASAASPAVITAICLFIFASLWVRYGAARPPRFCHNLTHMLSPRLTIRGASRRASVAESIPALYSDAANKTVT
jgi:hypothetical protein